MVRQNLVTAAEGITVKDVVVERQLASIPRVSGGMQVGMYIAPAMQQALEPAGSLLNKLGASRDAILKALVTVRGTQRVTDQNPESKWKNSRSTTTSTSGSMRRD